MVFGAMPHHSMREGCMSGVHKPGDHPIGNPQAGSSPPAAIQDEDLMPSQHGFGDDGTKATRFYKPDDGDNQMNEKGQDVVHPGIVSKSQKAAEFRPIFNSPPTGSDDVTPLRKARA